MFAFYEICTPSRYLALADPPELFVVIIGTVIVRSAPCTIDAGAPAPVHPPIQGVLLKDRDGRGVMK